MINTYRDLIVWQKGMKLTFAVYQLTNQFSQSEIYGLTSQIKRSVVSIPSNIAEGYRRNSRKDYSRFLKIAFGSGAELETQIEIARGLGFIDQYNFQEVNLLLDEVMKILNRMIATLDGRK